MASTTAPDTVLAPGHAAASAQLVGFDVSGFSGFVGSAQRTHGAHAGEVAADSLARGEAAVTALMSAAHFEWIDTTGDGAIYQSAHAPLEGRSLRNLLRESERAYFDAAGLKARFAQEAGHVAMHRLPFALEEQELFVWGEGIARLHQELQRFSGRSKSAPTAEPAFRSTAKAGDVSEHVFLFLRLLQAAQWESLDTQRLDEALLRLLEWVQPSGAQLDRVTHDEKGVHLRISAPAWTIASGWTAHMATPLRMLSSIGFPDACASLTTGPVYKGRYEGRRRVVHGVAINRAAKSCATLEGGQVSLDPSLDRHVFEARHRKGAGSFVGRTSVVEQGQSWLSGAGPRMVVLSGEPGIGKSEVARELMSRASSVVRVFVECSPSGAFQPFGLLESILRAAFEAVTLTPEEEFAFACDAMHAAGMDASKLALAANVLRSSVAELPPMEAMEVDERRTATERVLSQLLSMAITRFHLLLAIDDLHWADQGSLAALLGLLASDVPARIIATQRPTPANVRLNALLASPASRVESLGPLTAAEIGELICALDLRTPPIDAEQLHAISGGSPFHAIQAALLFAEGEKLDPDAVELTLDARLDSLSAQDLDAMRVLALHDRSIPWDEVLAVLSRLDADGPAPDAATRVGLIRRWYIRPAQEEGSVMLEHRLLRDALLRRMPVGVRHRLASAAARQFRDRTAAAQLAVEDWSEVARLWSEGGAAGRAAALYERAARLAAGEGAYAAASSLFECALRCAPQSRRGVQWHASRGAAQWSLGLTEQANESSRTAIKLARSVRLNPRLTASALTAAAVRAETGQFLGRLPDLLGGSMDVFRFASNRGDVAVARGRVVGSLAYLCGLARVKPLAAFLFRMGERIGSEEGNLLPSSYVLLSRAILRFINAAWEDGSVDLSRVRANLANLREPQLLEVLETLCGLGAHLQGEHELALSHFQVLGGLADVRGHGMHSAWARYASAQSLIALGRRDPAWSQLLEAEAILANVSDRQSDLICLGLRGRLSLAGGDLEGALHAAQEAAALGRTIPPTNFSSTEGYAAAAWIGAIVARNGTTAAQRASAAKTQASSCALLDRYAFMFPIARPRRMLVRAMSMPAAKAQASRALADKAHKLAQGMGMKGEAMLSQRVASWLRESPPHPLEMY